MVSYNLYFKGVFQKKGVSVASLLKEIPGRGKWCGRRGVWEIIRQEKDPDIYRMSVTNIFTMKLSCKIGDTFEYICETNGKKVYLCQGRKVYYKWQRASRIDDQSFKSYALLRRHMIQKKYSIDDIAAVTEMIAWYKRTCRPLSN